MITANRKILFGVEPTSLRLFLWLREATITVVRLYWELFVSLPITFFGVLFAGIAIVVGVMDISKHPSHLPSNLPIIGAALAFLISSRVRAFVWALLGCTILWVILVALLLLPILGADYKAVSVSAKILLGTLYFAPPAIGAFYIDLARNRRGKRNRGS